MTESGESTFEGIENQQDLLIDRDPTKKCLKIKPQTEDVDAFVRISRPHILLPNDVIRIGSLRFEVRRFNHATASVQGIRPSMEDEEYCRDGLLIDDRNSSLSMFNIYDGHGGMEASKFLRRSFHNFFMLHARNASVPDALLRTFQDADEALLSHVKERGYSMNVGSVVNSIVIDSCRNIFCANLGDCRSVLALESGAIINLSRDLNPSLPEEAQRIKRCGGFVSTGNRVNGRLAVSRAIGDFEYKTDLTRENMVSNIPEIRVHNSTGQEEFVVMGCDGLFDVMTSEEVATFVRDRASQFVSKRQEPDPNQICLDLITECVIKRGTSDNVTVVLIFLRQYHLQ
jgi:serine/threonine protein phosphatase PrpC